MFESAPDPATMDFEQINDELAALTATRSAIDARRLALIDGIEQRGLTGGTQARSTGHWISYRLGEAPRVARADVALARRLRDLPLVRAEVAAGRMSASVARTIARVATPENEGVLVETAADGTPAHVDKVCRMYPRVRATEDDEREDDDATERCRRRAKRWFRQWHDEDDNARGTYCLPLEEGGAELEEMFQQVFDAAREADRRARKAAEDQHRPEPAPEPAPAGQPGADGPTPPSASPCGTDACGHHPRDRSDVTRPTR